MRGEWSYFPDTEGGEFLFTALSASAFFRYRLRTRVFKCGLLECVGCLEKEGGDRV